MHASISAAPLPRLALALSALVAAALLIMSPTAAGEPQPFVRFATDFPTPATTVERFVPLVTDFPKPGVPIVPATTAIPEPSPSDWTPLALGGGVGVALAAALAGLGLMLTLRMRPVRS
jgi:hypothetical protein